MSIVVSVVKTFTKPHVLIGKIIYASTSFFLTIKSKLSYWSLVTCLQTNLLYFDRSSDNSFDCSFDYLFDHCRCTRPRSSYTQRRTSGSSPTVASILLEHQNAFLTKVINAVKIDPQRAFTPDCIYCLELNLKAELRKHMFTECSFAINNEFYQKTFIGVYVWPCQRLEKEVTIV